MSALTQLPNIGKTLAQQLTQVGVDSPEALARMGSRQAWLRIQQRDPSACYNRLCALEGAIRGVRWHDLDPAVKADLKTFYQDHRA